MSSWHASSLPLEQPGNGSDGIIFVDLLLKQVRFRKHAAHRFFAQLLHESWGGRHTAGRILSSQSGIYLQNVGMTGVSTESFFVVIHEADLCRKAL